LLALEHVGQGLERALVGARDGLAAPTVVEERIDRFLQHALFVADDDLGRVQLLQALETVVAVDHAAIEIVEIRRRETATVEGHEWAQVRRNHRNHFQHHPLGLVARLAEGIDDLEALGDLLALRLRSRLFHLRAQLLRELVHLDAAQKLANGLRAHASRESVFAHLLDDLRVALFGEKLAAQKTALLRIDDDVRLRVENLLEILERDVEQIADTRGQDLRNQMCATGVARLMWPRRSRRTFD
jgi:hypothetical protein